MALKRRARSGFTLVELMIALIAGSFAVAGIYYLNGVSSRIFGEQLRVSETQMSLRSAMEQLRRDFSRAGYLGIPNRSLAPNCDGSLPGGADVAPRLVRAISVTADGSLAGVNTLLGSPTTNRTRADLVEVWGNYATADAYLADPTRSGASTIFFQPASESFRRSFYDPVAGGADQYVAARFAATFAADRMVRVEHEGRVFFRDIQSVNAGGPDPLTNPPSVTLRDALPYCFDGSRWTAVAPIMRLRYGLELDSAGELERVRPNQAAIGSRRALLVRREISDRTGSVVVESSRVVLDYAVEFSVDAVVNTQAYGADPPAWDFVRNGDVTTQSNNAPENFRALLLTLSARSLDADPTLPDFTTAQARSTFAVANQFNSPLLMFKVIDPGQPTLTGRLNARVRTLRSEIFLQNL